MCYAVAGILCLRRWEISGERSRRSGDDNIMWMGDLYMMLDDENDINDDE